MKVFHGSPNIVRKPSLDKDKPFNDYGRGFYTTELPELAKEWACQKNISGFLNEYELDISDLKILNLTDPSYSILNWIALLLANRIFDLNSSLLSSYRQAFLDKYLIDISSYDIVIGYRADDSYFSYASSFLSNSIPLRVLSKAIELGDLGLQVVLVSEKAFKKLTFISSQEVDSKEYYLKFFQRDLKARKDYRDMVSNLQIRKSDIFVLDLIRGDKTK